MPGSCDWDDREAAFWHDYPFVLSCSSPLFSARNVAVTAKTDKKAHPSETI
jgi:hypothetical protein